MSRIQIEKFNNLGFKYVIEFVSECETVISLKGTDKSITVPMNIWQVKCRWENWQGRPAQYIQDAFHDFSLDAREFILSGITPEEWAELFPSSDEE